MAISHQRVPKDGWRFYEAKTNTSLISMDYEGLVRNVSGHRKANGINVGDVEGDIDKQIEEKHAYLAL